MFLRYEIATDLPDWADAEKQVHRTLSSHTKLKAKNGVSEPEVTVSVKSSKSANGKRKGETAEDVWKEEIGDKEAKRLKKGMKKAKA